MTRELSDLAEATGAARASDEAERNATLASLGEERLLTDGPPDLRRVVRVALTLEAEAMVSRGRMQIDTWGAAFACWSEIRLANEAGLEALAAEEFLLEPKVGLALHLAAAGSASERVPEARQALAAMLPSAADLVVATTLDIGWGAAVIRDAALAAVLLTRKGGGWADVDLALALVTSLRERQQSSEKQYLERTEEADVVRLVAGYHLAQLATVAGRYLETGDGASAGTAARIDTHLRQAQQAADLISDGELARLARLMHAVARPLVERSIWAQVEGVSDGARDLANALADHARRSPTLELWPSQVRALEGGVFDAYRRAIVVEMPTSGGKTLIAKFATVQALELNTDATVAYVVPTRVLVNQVTDELRRDFAPLGRAVEQAIPVFDLNPTEDILLQDAPDVLVTTPEKLDLLIRSGHPAVENLSLVVVDEAHNVGDSNRGARLELVLATIKRDKPNARFLMLSPFLPNAADLAAWLGGNRGTRVSVDWKPNKKVVGELSINKIPHPDRKNRVIRNVIFKTVDAVDNGGLEAGTVIHLGVSLEQAPSLAEIALVAERTLTHRGATLIVCSGKAPSVKRARKIASERAERQLSKYAAAVVHHVETELGADSDLAFALRRGVAYHHAGVSLETRRFIERLLADGDVDVVCGTTTLAQGANFPLSNVIIESHKIGRDDISHADFWNIAGRAGRGMLAGTGLVGFAVNNDDQRTWWTGFFKNEASSVASQLAEVLAKADQIDPSFGLGNLRRVKHLSEFLQYLAHALRVSGSLQSANEVEDLLRNSLMFTSTERTSPADADRLVRICRDYLETIRNRGQLVALADGTGFSTSTVGFLQASLKEAPAIRNDETWAPQVLFGSNLKGLTDRVRLIGDLPEMTLGENDEGTFNPERVAKILRDWVNGSTIPALVEKYGDKARPEETRHAAFVSYLQGKLTGLASWGLGALERVALAGGEPDNISGAQHVPAMVLYGVNEKEAVWLRMAGLSRELAMGGAQLWREQGRVEPASFEELRTWISQVKDSDWDRATKGTAFEPGDVRLLWDVTSS